MKALGKGSIASWVKVGLDFVRVLLWLAAVILIGLSVAYAIMLAITAVGALDRATLAELEGSIRFGDREVGGYGWPAVVPALLAGGVVVGGALVIVGRLRKLFEGFSSGEPFRREYADHLRVIWIAMLVIELARYALLALRGVLVSNFGEPVGSDLTFQIEIDLSTWLSIFVLIALAEVFREGARLKEEQELTI
jgi:hypothetical protein